MLCRCLSPQADATRSTKSLQAAEAATADLQLRLVDMAAAAVAAREADIQAALDAARNSAAAAAEREAAAASAAELRELKAAHMELQQLHARYCRQAPWLCPCISPQYELNCLRILSSGWPCGVSLAATPVGLSPLENTLRVHLLSDSRP